MRALRIALSLYPLVGGVLGMLGWALNVPHLRAWHTSGITMKFNTALCAALVGAALLLATTGVGARLARALAMFVAAFGGLTLLEHLTGASFGIDTLFFDEPPGALATAAPGRMGPPAALSFLLLGVSIALAFGGARARKVASALALAPVALAGLAMVGYAYGASSRFDMRLSPGPFMAAAGVQTDKTPEALQEFFKELNRIQEPVGADELTRAKNYVALSFPSEFETIGDLASHLEELVVYKLPDNYFERYVPNIRAVTAAAVQKAAATYIQPKKMTVVVVGDRKVIEAKVRALNLGPLQFLSVDQVVGS